MKQAQSGSRNKIPQPLILDASFIPNYTGENGTRVKWKILENTPPIKFFIGDLEPVCFLKGKETNVRGEEMRRRAVALGANLGLADAIRVYDNWTILPPKLWNTPLVFPATLFFNPQNGGKYIIYLKRFPDRCKFNFCRIDGKTKWLGKSYLLRPKKRGE